MTLINHFEAVRLEHIVCNVYNCERGGIGRMANADIFEDQPTLSRKEVLLCHHQKTNAALLMIFINNLPYSCCHM